ncbi:biliverdin-producing heme oxygenase [Streptomyces pinistramenti]|uniref:biliverdin-producing heme oxygenase n=1 Tax=Streptomyces pinistramenti TaxID=2884812 RepID=UPI001D06B0BC|nr:biliverdin-producing heme oxygenase [Streptomyces pinistramenti]MCB5907148.1 biliverdin-producing heme oxygenase [Streptomyces pinistramenti]
MEAPSSTPPTPFSALIRAATHELHTEAQSPPFMNGLLAGRLGVPAYRRYTEQLWFVYRALEDTPRTLAQDPVAGPFIRPELARTAELERDLAHLGGPSWSEDLEPLPATAAYAARIRQCARDWPAGYVAHHYTRYLGDLSGGQIIRGTAEKTWGFDRKGDGVRFYVFEDIANPAAFKREYRELLDALPVDDLEKQRVIDECKRAFTLNSAVFQELGTQFPLSA